MDAAYAFGNHRNIDCCFAKATCSLHAVPSFEMPIQIARFKSARCFVPFMYAHFQDVIVDGNSEFSQDFHLLLDTIGWFGQAQRVGTSGVI